MSTPIAYIVLDESSPRLIAGQYQFDRVCSGALIIPSGSAFPGQPFAGEIFWRTDLSGLFRRTTANDAWEQAIPSAAAGDPDASYLVLGNTSSLSNERAVTASLGIKFEDGGANLNLDIKIDESTIPVLSASNTFTGPNLFSSGLSGSLTQLTDGTSYLIAGPHISIATQSNGSIIISNTESEADKGASYIVISNTSSLPNERALSSSLGNKIIDNGANSTVEINIDEVVIPVLSASNTFTSPNIFTNGLSGSLTRLSDNTSYIIGQGGVAVTSASNGAITISGSIDTHRAIGGSDRQIQFNDSDELGGNTNFWISSSNALLASGSFTSAGAIIANLGFSGSLTKLIDGTSYIIQGPNVTISSASNGSVTISTSIGAGDVADIDASYIVIGNTASLPNERAVTGSFGVRIIDNGANSTVDFRINELEIPILSASNTFTNPNIFTNGLSGSLTHLSDGTSYMNGVGGITVITQSNGSLLISGTHTGPAGADRQIQFNNAGVLGANTNFWISSSNDILASGSISSAVTISADLGFSGSLTRLTDGTSAFIAGPNITVISSSNGAIIIQSEVGAGDIADIDASYIVIGNTASLPNERSITGSLGVRIIDNGANSTVDFKINELEIPILSASNTFTGDINLSGGGLVLQITGSTRITGSVYISGSSVDGSEVLLELDGSGSAEFHGNRIRHAGVAELDAASPNPPAEGMFWYDTSGAPGGVAGQVPVLIVTGVYTTTSDNTVILANATSDAFTINLVPAAGNGGKIYYIKKIDATSNNVTVDGNGPDTIDDELTIVIQNQYTALMIVSDNNEWWIL